MTDRTSTPKSGRRKTEPLAFLTEAFGGTAGRIYLISLDNTGATKPVEHWTADPLTAVAFVKENDRPGRGMFFSVSTIAGLKRKRNKKTACETRLANVDLDLKHFDETVEEILAITDALPFPPTRVHASGNGLHLYWVRDAPALSGDDTEAIQRKLRIMLDGDRAVAHCVALMRLPGSHNTKDGQWKEVRVLRNTGRLYSMAELRNWRQPPILAQRGGEPLNAFDRIGEEYGIKPRLDVDARFAEMVWHGHDKAAIHNTKLSTTAALLSRGEEVEDVVAKVLSAVREHVGDDPRWDWEKEERLIRGMCNDWIKKHGEKPR